LGSGERSLKGHFGFDDNGEKVKEIVDVWINGIQVEFVAKKSTTNLGLGMRIYTINRSFADVLALDASYQDTGKSMKAALLRAPTKYSLRLPWLKWLLLEGDKKVLLETNHTIHFKPGVGRSGQAVMTKSKTKRWGIPIEYAGTLRDNWITHIIDDVEPQIEGMVENLIESKLS
jgi:hypothetical protein